MSSYSESNMVELAGKILVVSIVVVSVVVVFVFFVHLYAKWFWYRREEGGDGGPTTGRRRRRGDFTAGHQEPGVTVLRRGLDASFLKTIPVILFDPKDFKDGLECTVCLSELVEGEKARILPKCNHGFHVECIDMWFHSHSTCPICRNPVSDQTEISVENLLESRQTQEQSRESVDSQEFPTNMLFWGDETEVIILTSQLEEANSHHPHQAAVLTCETSSSSSQINRPDLVIDIPRLIDDENEDEKTPVSSRMRSLRRILSGSRRFINPFSPANSNIEQGTRSHR